MTEAQKRFCDEYLIDLNATRAYKVAYPRCKKDETARANSSRLLTNANIQEYIKQRQEELQEETKVTQQKVIDELAAIAFFNIKNIYNENGSLKSVKEMDDETAKAISSVKTLQKAGSMKIEVNPNGKDVDIPVEHIAEQTIEYKTNDKKGALELLGKHLRLFNDKTFNINMNYEEYLKKVEGNEY